MAPPLSITSPEPSWIRKKHAPAPRPARPAGKQGRAGVFSIEGGGVRWHGPCVKFLASFRWGAFPLVAFLFSCAPSLFADGGVILAREKVNGLDLTVFASPVPLRAGPVDVSVLVQDAAGQAVLDAKVDLGWTTTSPTASTDWLPPCCSMETALGKTSALRTHSQNKLLYGAILPVRSAGPSEISVTVQTSGAQASLAIPVEALPPRAPVLAYWPLLAFPPAAIGLFAMHQRLSRRGR